MAKVLFTAVVADMRGKLNGTVFSRNRGGSYTRTKSSPTNPATIYQQNQRSVLAAYSSAWRGLSQAQRDSWIAGASNFPYTDIFGSVKSLSGQQLYAKLNIMLVNTGNAAITTCPTPVSVPQVSITAAAAAAGAGTMTVTISPTTIPAGYSLQIWATTQLSPGIAFATNKFRLLGKFTVTAGAANIASAYISRFGSLTAGKKIFYRVVFVSNTTGQVGIGGQFNIVVAA